MSNQAPATPFAGGARATTSSRKGARVFTVCGHTGPTGPSQEQADKAYSGTTLNGEVTIDKGVQIWSVPSSGRYTIEALGARGGNKAPGTGGSGARIVGSFDLSAGDVLRIHVGQQGQDCPNRASTNGSGGGGGSFVFLNGKAILIAGGGGGTSYQKDSGSGGSADQYSVGGGYGQFIDGQGGKTDNGGGGGTGAGGGGLYGHGQGNNWSKGGFKAGGNGNDSSSKIWGGFGGGGGSYHGGGGGGGYTGGGGGLYKVGGGGGGSYNTGFSPINQASYNQGDGQVIISLPA